MAANSDYDHIVRHCLKTHTLWEDPEFPAVQSSVFYHQTPPFSFQWKRPHVSFTKLRVSYIFPHIFCNFSASRTISFDNLGLISFIVLHCFVSRIPAFSGISGIFPRFPSFPVFSLHFLHFHSLLSAFSSSRIFSHLHISRTFTTFSTFSIFPRFPSFSRISPH